MKKMYVKPTIKTVEWDFQNPVCNTVYQCSPCIVIDQGDGNTRIDYYQDDFDQNLNWESWNR